MNPKDKGIQVRFIADNEYVSPKELADALKMVADTIRIVKDTATESTKEESNRLENRLNNLSEQIKRMVENSEKRGLKDIESLAKKITKIQSDIQKDFQNKFDEIVLPDVTPFLSRSEYTADREAILAEAKTFIKEVEKDTPEMTRDSLESLEGDDRLDKTAIKGLDDYDAALASLSQSISSIPRGGGGSGGIEVFKSGTKVGGGSALNFTGAGVSTVTNTDGRMTTVTITGGGGGGTPGGSSGDVQWNNGGSFDGFGTFNGTNQLDLTDISLISAGVTTTGLFNQSGDQASFNVAGSTFAVKTTAYNSWGLIYTDNTGLVTMGDYFGDANTTSIAIDDTATTIGYSATGGHTFTGNVIVDTDTLYVDSTNNTVSVGTTSSLSKLAVVTDALGTTQTDTSGLVLANTTAATSGVTRQISPGLRFRGNAWKTDATAASQTIDFRQYVSVNAGTSAASGDLFWQSSVNGGAYSIPMGLSTTGLLTLYGALPRTLEIIGSSSSIVGFRVQNTSNASVSAHARYEMTTGGASGGDPYTAYTVNGVTNWSEGIDNSDNDSYKISESAVLGTNDRFILRTGGLASVRAGLATSKQATLGGAIKEYFTSVGNVTTGEDDLFTYTTEANIFGTNGDNIEGEYSGTTAANGNNKTFKFYFAGTNILNSGALALNDKNWKFSFKLIRVSATVVRYSVQFTYEGNTAEILEVGELTGLTLSGTNILKITGEATATDDIVATMGTVTATPVSV